MSLTYQKPDISGNPHSVSVAALVETKTANYTVLASDNGKTFLSALDGIVFTLPPTANGLEFTFISTAADGAAAMNISPDAADMIYGTFTLAATIVKLTGVDDTDIVLAKADQVIGDFVRLTADQAGTGWIITNSSGIWASA